MADPFLVQPPALVSFSGGRTSGYMLYRILQSHGGKLPRGLHVAFFNTGKEREETLRFVRQCQARWRVRVRWLEYERLQTLDGRWSNTYREVSFRTASRRGEPFEKLITARSYLPNVVTRFCTAELKVRTGKRFMLDQGYEHWTNVIGIRADEAHRAKREERERWERLHPLLEADITEQDVMAFWSAQPFDLQLRRDEGNCDLCFLKGKRKLVKLIAERPQSADWWIEQERRIESVAPGRAVARFRDRYSVRDLLDLATSPGPLFTQPPDDEVEDCHCTD